MRHLMLCLLLAAALGATMILSAGPIAATRDGVQTGAVRLAGTWILLLAGIRACRPLSIGFERIANTLFMTPVAELAKMLWVFVCAALGLPVIWIFIGWTGAFALALLAAAVKDFTPRVARRAERAEPLYEPQTLRAARRTAVQRPLFPLRRKEAA